MLKRGLEDFAHYFAIVWDREMNPIVWQFEHSLALTFFWIGWKLTFQGVATAEFSKFAGILSVALSQHYLLGFEIAQLEFHPSTSFVHSDAS